MNLSHAYISYSEQVMPRRTEIAVGVTRSPTFGTAVIVSTSGSTDALATVRTSVTASGNSARSAVITSGI